MKTRMILAAAVLGVAATAHGAAIIQPVAVSTSLVGWGWDLNWTINQAGLYQSYVSGVTDFDVFIGQGPRHDNNAFTTWASTVGVSSGSLVFGLGGPANIESFALWNRGFSQQGVRDFDLFISDDAGFTTSTLLGSFTAPQQSSSSGTAVAQVFSFAATTGSFVRMDIHNVYGTCCISMSEVAFEANPLNVPEPGSLLLGATALALGGLRRRFAPVGLTSPV